MKFLKIINEKTIDLRRSGEIWRFKGFIAYYEFRIIFIILYINILSHELF